MTQARRERIIAAAFALFAERGLEATTLVAIEEASGLAPGRGGIYRYFPDKESILRAAIIDDLERVRPRRQGEVAELPEDFEALEANLRGAIDSVLRMRQLVAILVRDGVRFPDLQAEILDGFVNGGIAVNTAGLANVVDGHQPVDLQRLGTMLLTTTVGAALLISLVDPASPFDDQALVDGLGVCLREVLHVGVAGGTGDDRGG